MNIFDLHSSPISKQLNELAEQVTSIAIKSFFETDAHRMDHFTVSFDGLYADFSKQQLDQRVLNALLDLAKEAKVKEAIQAQFAGDQINVTEQRSVLHAALRADRDDEFVVDGTNVMSEVYEVLDRMEAFTQNVLAGTFTGYTGQPFTDVVNIGIGGSDLGPAMVSKALESQATGLKAHFVSNVDGADLASVLRKVPAETTLFIVVSKTFTTQETLANANAAKSWLVEQFGDQSAVANHFVAVSTNLEAVAQFGIAKELIFGFWEWVGGRYSLWSAVGLSIALSAGWDLFRQLLDGAKAMDDHFRSAPFHQNIPVLSALIGVWNRNFLHRSSLAVIPYSQDLSRFPAYLQQADMESNGKYVGKDGKPVQHQTGPVVWGEPGTNGQHAFFQLLHQGTEVIPVDFIAYIRPTSHFKEHHTKLMANCFAQGEALMNGKSRAQVNEQLKSSNLDSKKAERVAPFKVFEGNRPSTTYLFNQLDAHSLGMLIAMYEHKIYVQGTLWNVYSYDQWGVELGKELANRILPVLEEGKEQVQSVHFDPSTQELIDRFSN